MSTVRSQSRRVVCLLLLSSNARHKRRRSLLRLRHHGTVKTKGQCRRFQIAHRDGRTQASML